MRWKGVPLDGSKPSGDLDDAEAFLRDHEASCAAACARFLHRDKGRDRLFLGRDAEDRPAALVFRSGGILHPVLQGNSMPRGAAGRGVRSLQGRAEDVAAAAETLAGLGYVVSECIDYHLMDLDGPPAPETLDAGPEDLRIRRFDGPQNIPRAGAELYPLQEAYEREEVLPSGASFNTAACRLGLERLVREQWVVAAELDGRIVAKANTNARAFTRSQLGGIYVLPEYRRKGIAARLTAHLSEEIRKAGRIPCLFVKKRNIAAIATYEKIGFKIQEDYRIIYY